MYTPPSWARWPSDDEITIMSHEVFRPGDAGSAEVSPTTTDLQTGSGDVSSLVTYLVYSRWRRPVGRIAITDAMMLNFPALCLRSLSDLWTKLRFTERSRIGYVTISHTTSKMSTILYECFCRLRTYEEYFLSQCEKATTIFKRWVLSWIQPLHSGGEDPCICTANWCFSFDVWFIWSLRLAFSLISIWSPVKLQCRNPLVYIK